MSHYKAPCPGLSNFTSNLSWTSLDKAGQEAARQKRFYVQNGASQAGQIGTIPPVSSFVYTSVLLTKSEAAIALGVSEKTVSRYVAAGRLPARYVRGKTAQKLEIAPHDVARLQLELENRAPQSPQSPVMPSEPLFGTGRPESAPESQITALARDSEALAPEETVPSPTLTLAALARIVRAVMDESGHRQTKSDKSDKARVPIESKLLLSLDEAAALSGMPRAHLDAARRDGQLSARKIGRSFKIRRDELERFVASLWKNEPTEF